MLNVDRAEIDFAFEFFALNTKLPIMAMFVSKNFTAAKKLPQVGLDLMITESRV